MNTLDLKIELKFQLEEVIKWSNRFLYGEKDYSFDIDNKLHLLSKKYNLDFETGNLYLIYSLVDYYTDAIKHNFQEVYDNYYLSEAKNDILEILDTLEIEKERNIYLPNNLERRLSLIFGKR